MDNTVQAVAFDVDGTLLQFTIWPQLHALFNFPLEEEKRLYALYHEKKISYRDWMEEIYGGYLRKGPVRYRKDIEPLMRDFKFVPGVESTIAALKKKYPVALVSSSLMDYIGKVGATLGVEDVYTFTHLLYDANDAYSGLGYSGDGDEILMKVSSLADWGTKIGLAPNQIAFVGDSVNDMGAFRYTGHGILIGESTEAMRNVAWRRIRAIPELLDIL